MHIVVAVRAVKTVPLGPDAVIRNSLVQATVNRLINELPAPFLGGGSLVNFDKKTSKYVQGGGETIGLERLTTTIETDDGFTTCTAEASLLVQEMDVVVT
mgnify:FL=1